MKSIYLGIVLAPLVGTVLAGIFGHWMERKVAHIVTIGGVATSFVLSLIVFQDTAIDGNTFNGNVYTWLVSDGISFNVGFLVDQLTAMMLVVVSFVSLMVHIYTIGYMQEDPGYKRFFSYISLFTFAMFMLVMSNNFMQLFFGWEAVGVVSYLLIGFWFQKETAIYANLKAFLVNRVGDFGFLLGIAAVLLYFGTLDYAEVFAGTAAVEGQTIEIFEGAEWSVMSVICILLFIGAMGKSAQVPLHVWLPDSMEGPTPISALIHAATMVTAGIFMVARMSPLFELSETALSVVLVIGAITALFMGFLGLVQHDIKRVVAYSTLSQLGYMTVALGASAYAAGVFHLMTHAFFKALLFLAAGSVIIALHHEQDMRHMGGLKKYLPITYWTSLVGSLALIGFPGFSGFFSKDAIIEAVHASNTAGSTFAYIAVLLGVFITALYSFRMFFLVFHGEERFHKAHHHHDDEHNTEVDEVHGHGKNPHEPPWVVTGPLIALAIPSLLIGAFFVEPMLFSGFFGDAIQVKPEHDVLAQLGEGFHGVAGFVLHGVMALPFWLALAGVGTAYYFYRVRPDIPEAIQQRFSTIHSILESKYGFDRFNEIFFAGGARGVGGLLWKYGDMKLIDGLLVNGSAYGVGKIAAFIRHLQSGYLYHYAFAMIIGLLVMLAWVLYR
ncbi:MAG: NADH-quinone oxidoreductase subunit L [Gammaproteobacteria bacterium]|jgi:NADH-quinone oxidoreductase subunit L|nr:NADH-quinone oxidoreductase subunit L [Gammaproteobacteria bacterium]